MRTFWILVDHYNGALVLVGLATPFLLVALAMSIERSRAKVGGVPHFGYLSFGGCAIGTVLGLGLLLLAMCSTPVGKGEKAEAWYAATTPIIDALDRYHMDRGAYPVSLSMLVPKYLDSAKLPKNQHDFTYRSDSGEYRLTFRYNGPGSNTCTRGSREKRWSCHGLY